MSDADPDFEWPTIYIQIVPRLAGFLSVMSSATIIYLVFRSQTRVSSIYHQIMLCMSIFDIMGSLGMALTTIPMPREMPQEKELGFEWPGGRYGNHATCAAQGFFTLFGSVAMFGFNATLCLYYACAVAFQMKEKTIRRYILPIIYGLPIVTGFGFAITMLVADSFNPPTNFSLGYWCVADSYPSGCTDEESTCFRGDFDVMHKAQVTMIFAIVLGVLIMITSLILVVYSRFRIHRLTQKFVKAAENDGASNHLPISSSHKDRLERLESDTTAIILQSVAYITAFISGVIWPFLASTGDYNNMTMFKFGLFFIPLQGFFNLAVFLSHKIHNYRRVHRETSRWQVVKLLFLVRVEEPCFVSRISMVVDDDIQAHIDDRVKTGLPFFRTMNEMDVEECELDIANVDIKEERGSDRDRDKNIEYIEDDSIETFVDDQRQNMNMSKNESKSSNTGPFQKDTNFSHGMSSMSSSFQVSGSSNLDISGEDYGLRRKSDMGYLKARGHTAPGSQADKNNSVSQYESNNRMMVMHSKNQGLEVMDDVSKGGLSGFSSILRSAASFATSVTPGSKGRGQHKGGRE